MSFSEFNFSKDLNKGLKIAGFREPSPIQKEAIPLVLDGVDIVAQAHTGTGKTAAFGLPIIDKIASGEIERALVITPTRELATQVSDELYHLGRFAGVRTLAVYGGVGYGRQIALINKGVDIVVATPGRLKDLYNNGKIDSFNPEIVVLDEADEMLDMGFLDSVREIFEYIPQNRQTLLFSATMPDAIKDLAQNILYNPEYISVVSEDESTTNNKIVQKYFVIQESQRDEAIVRLLESEDYNKALIFCRMKREVDRVSEHLKAMGFDADGLHGDIDQLERDRIVKEFRRNKIKVLVATDVAARGLDIKGVTHVFNYHIPFDPQSYVHRIGRTGRAGKDGKAITLVSLEEFRELKRIQKEVGANMELSTIVISQGEFDQNEVAKLKNRVDSFDVNQNIDIIMESFKDCNKDELIAKLLSYVVKKENISSTQMLGFEQESVDRFYKEYIQAENAKKSKKRKRR
jgi:ATP-dependent RNA helicase DeaD